MPARKAIFSSSELMPCTHQQRAPNWPVCHDSRLPLAATARSTRGTQACNCCHLLPHALSFIVYMHDLSCTNAPGACESERTQDCKTAMVQAVTCSTKLSEPPFASARCINRIYFTKVRLKFRLLILKCNKVGA